MEENNITSPITMEDIFGHKHTLTSEISRGGQGVVFRTDDPNIAVKLSLKDGMPIMNPSGNTVFNKLRLLPLPHGIKLTMPKAVLIDAEGYIMDLLEDMNSFNKLFYPGEPRNSDGFWLHNEWIDGLAENNVQLAQCFASYIYSGASHRRLLLYMKYAGVLTQLHCAGMVFCDVSNNNVFASSDLDMYNVWLIDSDNVNYQAVTLKGNSVYTPGYAAPEVLELGQFTMYSDCFAFAVALFETLTLNHPFKGSAFETLYEEQDYEYEEAENIAYGGSMPWICDEDDPENILENGTCIPCDYVMTNDLMRLFQRTFGKEGREDAFSRPTMPEWAEALAREADITVNCPHCGMGGIYHKSGVCLWCDSKEKVIKLTSYLIGENEPLWEFVKEYDGNAIEIPSRMVDGFAVSRLDVTVFTLKGEGNYLILGNVCSDFSVAVLDNGDYVDVAGNYKLCEEIRIKVTPKNGLRGVLIEGSVIK